MEEDIENADRKRDDVEREIEELGLSEQKFETIENDLHDLLQEISKDKSLERFRLEYEKLHKTLKTSHETEKKLIKRCKELNMEISSHSVKVQIALKLNHDDNNAMEQTKNDVERTWKMVDQMREKEEILKKKLSTLRHQLTELTRRIETDDTAPVEQQQMLENLKKSKDAVLEQKEELMNKLTELRNNNADLLKTKIGLETDKQALQDSVNELKEKIRKSKEEAEAQEKRKKDLELQMNEINEQRLKKSEELKEKQTEKEQLKVEIAKLEGDINVQIEKKNAQEEKFKDAKTKNMRAENDLRAKNEAQKSKMVEKQQMEQNIEKISEELGEKERLNNQITKEIMVMTSKIKELTYNKEKLEREKEESKNELLLLQKFNTDLRRENDSDRKKIEATVRSINKLNKTCIDYENRGRYQADENVMKKNELRKINNELKASRKEIAKLNALIYQLKRDEAKYSLEASNAQSKNVQTGEQVKIKTSLIAQLRKENLETEKKLKKYQDLYEAALADRNLYSKNLLESDAQKNELRQKYSMLTNQISKLRDEISDKSSQIRKERHTLAQVQDKNEKDTQEKKRLDEKDRDKETHIKNYENQINELKYYIAEAEQEKMKQKKEYEMVINDRDILGSQLIKRNSELGSLYEKIKIQQSTLAKGAVSYQERVIEANSLKEKIAELKKEHLQSKAQVSSIPELKREIYRLEKDLMEIRTKVKALSEELQNPMNVHRYRKLEGTSPEKYEMILKIQTLHRRLIAKTEEVAEKEFLIQEKEKLYIELKNILARQPKPEVAEQLGVYRENIKEKTKQMKQMIEELNAAHAQVNLYKFEIERYNNEIRDMKEHWFQSQRSRKELPIIPEEP